MRIYDSLVSRKVRAARDRGDVDAMLAALNSQRAYVRQIAASGLGDVKDERAVEALIAGLAHADRTVAMVCAGSLGRIGDGRAVEPLIDVLAHDTGGRGGAAIDALARLGDERAVEPLCALLTDSSASYVYDNILSALGQLGDARAVDPLIGFLASSDGQRHAVGAVGALAALRDPRAIEPLRVAISAEQDKVQRLEEGGRVGTSDGLLGMDMRYMEGRLRELEALTGTQPKVAEPGRAADSGTGPMGERYCSERCSELGGQTVARHQIQGWSGDCSVCREPLSIGNGSSGSMVCYKPGLFLYFHQREACVDAVRAELARGSACVVCGNPVD